METKPFKNYLKLKLIVCLTFSIIKGVCAFSQTLNSEVVYKIVDTSNLKLEIIYPKIIDKDKQYPAIVFFFGGGWITGSINQFRKQANYLSNRGMICFLADYRVQKRQGTSPFESLMDAKSAMRYIRKNASVFHINPNKIVASGGSAGGHLAAATALISGYNDINDDISVNANPNVLVLFNPVIDNGPGGYGYERISDHYKDFSPLYNISKKAPPTIVFQGTNDDLIPVATAKLFRDKMVKEGNKCELFLYEGQPHGFFNKKEYVTKTMAETDRFLTALGYLKQL